MNLHYHEIKSPIKRCTVIRKNCRLCGISHYISGTSLVNQFIYSLPWIKLDFPLQHTKITGQTNTDTKPQTNTWPFIPAFIKELNTTLLSRRFKNHVTCYSFLVFIFQRAARLTLKLPFLPNHPDDSPFREAHGCKTARQIPPPPPNPLIAPEGSFFCSQ